MAKEKMLDYKFNLGWNADLSPIMVSNEELVLADNAEIIDRGGLRKRFGVEPVNSTSYVAQVEQMISWPRDNGTEDILAIIGTDLCKVDLGGNKTVIQALNSSRIPYFFLQDKFYFIDPGTEYYVYDGISCSPVTPNPDPSNNLSPIKRCKFAFWHSKSARIFFAGDSQEQPAVYYSEFNDPTFVQGTSVVYPTRADGPVKGLSVLMDAIIVGYRYSNWIWRGMDPKFDAVWERLPTSHGPLNGDCFTITTNSLSMVSEGGVFALSPSIIGIPMDTEVGANFISNIAKNRVLSVIKNITDKDRVRTIFDADTGLYMIAYCDDGTGRNNKLLVFDWDLKAFSRYEGIKINDFCQLQNGDILLATENYILRVNEDSTEDFGSDGVARIINFHIKTSKYNFGFPFQKKQISKIYIIFKNYGELHELNVNLYVDDILKHQFASKGDNSGTEIVTYVKKTTHVGNNFQLEITNTQYSKVELYAVGFEWKPVETVGDRA